MNFDLAPTTPPPGGSRGRGRTIIFLGNLWFWAVSGPDPMGDISGFFIWPEAQLGYPPVGWLPPLRVARAAGAICDRTLSGSCRGPSAARFYRRAAENRRSPLGGPARPCLGRLEGFLRPGSTGGLPKIAEYLVCVSADLRFSGAHEKPRKPPERVPLEKLVQLTFNRI